jgi:hypothetical protein
MTAEFSSSRFAIEAFTALYINLAPDATKASGMTTSTPDITKSKGRQVAILNGKWVEFYPTSSVYTPTVSRAYTNFISGKNGRQ